MNMANKRFKCLNVEEQSFDYLSFITDRLNMKKSVFLRLLLEELFSVFNEFKKGSCNMFFDSMRGQLILTVTGDSYVEVGTRLPCKEIREKEAKAKPILRIIPEKTKLTGALKDE